MRHEQAPSSSQTWKAPSTRSTTANLAFRTHHLQLQQEHSIVDTYFLTPPHTSADSEAGRPAGRPVARSLAESPAPFHFPFLGRKLRRRSPLQGPHTFAAELKGSGRRCWSSIQRRTVRGGGRRSRRSSLGTTRNGKREQMPSGGGSLRAWVRRLRRRAH